MTVEAVKKKIKKKFGTYSNFTRIAGLDRYEFQRDFLTANIVDKLTIAGIDAMVDKLTHTPLEGSLTPEKIEALQEAINSLGGISAFCKEHPEFNKNTVAAILSGRISTGKPGSHSSPIAKKMFEVLGL